MISAIHAGLAEAYGFDEEPLSLFDLSDREQRAKKSVHGFARADLRSRPSLALVAAVFHELITETGRVAETNEPLSKALLNRILIHAVALQMVLPEWQRSAGHGERCGVHLARAWAAAFPAIRESSHHRTGLHIRVRVVKMINGYLAVHEHRLLRHAKTDGLREEIDVLLCAACTGCDVVISG